MVWKLQISKINIIILLLLSLLNHAYIFPIFIKNLTGTRAVCSVVLLIISFFTIYFRRKIYISKNIKYIYLIWMLIFFSLLRTKSPIYGGEKFFQFTYINLVLFSVPYIINFSFIDLKKFYKYMLILNLFSIVFSIMINYEIFLEFNGRLSYFDINPIWLGRFFGQTILLILFLKFEASKNIRFILNMVNISCMLLLVYAGSKGPIVALLLSLIIIKMVSKNKNLNINKVLKYFINIFILIIICTILLKIITEFFPSDFIINRFSISEGSGDNGRISLINKSIDAIIRNPFIGYGIGSYSYIEGGIDIRSYPHNIILEILIEIGLLGIICLIIPTYRIAINSIKSMSSGLCDNFEKLTYCSFIYSFINALVSGDLVSNCDLFLFIALSDIIAKKALTINR